MSDPAPSPVPGDAPPVAPPKRRAASTKPERAAVVRRLYSAIDKTLTKLEAAMATDEPLSPADRERETRALHTIIRMLWQHDPAQPIGTWLSIYEDARGLKVRGRLAIQSTRARDVLALMKAGAVDGLSIGFRAVDTRRDKATGLRRLTRIDLWEISVVTFPMMPDARISAVKSAPGALPAIPPARGGCRPTASLNLVNSEIDEAARLIRAAASPKRRSPLHATCP